MKFNKRILLILAVLLAAGLSFGTIAKRHGVALAGGCSTTDTSLAHDTLLEGFQNASGSPVAGYQDQNSLTWTETGTTANIDSYFDTSALTTGLPDGACDRAWKITVPEDGTETYATVDLGSTIDIDTQELVVAFAMYVEDAMLTSQAYYIFSATPGTAPGTQSVAGLELGDGSGTLRIRAAGATYSNYINLSVDTWYVVTVTIATGTGATDCSINIGATTETFQRSAYDVRYLTFGPCIGLSALEEGTVIIDLICADQT